MASTTTLYRTADWTNAQTAHGPTLAAWLRHELRHHDDLTQRFGDTFTRFLNRCEAEAENTVGGDHFVSFWTVDKWLTHVDLHPGQAPFGVWSLEPTQRDRRNAERAAAARAA